jgi:regulator of cell morphogenesis and NO signaling
MRRLRKSDKIGLIVAADIETASVFNYYGIDFYSKGNRTLEEACINENVPIVSLLDDLSRVVEPKQSSHDFLRLNVKDLVHYILRRHHRFTEGRLIFIKHALTSILNEYEDEGDILRPVKNVFEDLSLQLTVQMNYEEFLIFPALEKIERRNKPCPAIEYRKVIQHLTYMKDESSRDVVKLMLLREATHRYTAKGRDETLYEIAYSAMKELENDLRIHMHLENNVLFPKVFNYCPEDQTELDVDQQQKMWFYNKNNDSYN